MVKRKKWGKTSLPYSLSFSNGTGLTKESSEETAQEIMSAKRMIRRTAST
ncbi:hypothetical protein A2U01_0103550, partial [Trifolium medium]|nr:hypothetical protein [Trifolium medium]